MPTRLSYSILLAFMCLTQFAFASSSPQIEVIQAKARATFAMANTGAAYCQIVNNTEKDDLLLSVSVSESVASMVELHTVAMVDEMMRMQELEEGIPLPAGQTVTLKPGGKHIMFMGLTGPLNAGGNLVVTFHFKHAESQTINMPIVKM